MGLLISVHIRGVESKGQYREKGGVKKQQKQLDVNNVRPRSTISWPYEQGTLPKNPSKNSAFPNKEKGLKFPPVASCRGSCSYIDPLFYLPACGFFDKNFIETRTHIHLVGG